MPSFVQRLRVIGLGLVGVALSLGLWQLLSEAKVLDPSAIPSMTAALDKAGYLLGTSELWVAIGQTLESTAIGFALGSAAGVLVGTAVGLNKYAYGSCFLVVEFFRTIPAIAILPLAVLLLGTTLKMKVVLIVFGGFFPTVIQTVYGVRSVDMVIRDTADIFRLGPLRRFTTVIMPSAAPFIATGLRLGATGALLLDIVAEITAGGSGIGRQILQTENAGAVSYTYGLLIITGVLGTLLVIGVSAIERRVMSWHEVYRVS